MVVVFSCRFFVVVGVSCHNAVYLAVRYYLDMERFTRMNGGGWPGLFNWVRKGWVVDVGAMISGGWWWDGGLVVVMVVAVACRSSIVVFSYDEYCTANQVAGICAVGVLMHDWKYAKM